MQLRSTYEVYREAIAPAPHDRQLHEQAQQAVDDYLYDTEVLLENRGDEPFAGDKARFDGREYRIDPGKTRRVPLAAAIHFLGNWAATGERRRFEHEFLKARYGYFESLASHDLDLFITRSQALSQALSLKGLPKEMRVNLEKAIHRLPQPSQLPQLAVLDPETQEELNCRWPLYDPNWEPEPDDIPPEIRPIYDALVEKFRQDQAEAEKDFIRRFEEQVGSLDDLEDEEG